MKRAAALLSALALAGGLTACTHQQTEARRHAPTKLAVTIASGPMQQTWARDIAKRYAPHGTFTIGETVGVEETVGSDVTLPSGASQSTQSTVVTLEVTGDINRIITQLQREPHVESVARG